MARAVLAGRGWIGLRLNESRFNRLKVTALGRPKLVNLAYIVFDRHFLRNHTSWCLLKKATALVMTVPERILWAAGWKNQKARQTIRRIDEDLGISAVITNDHSICAKNCEAISVSNGRSRFSGHVESVNVAQECAASL